MPDKHEVGGSTPLEPTRAGKAGKAKATQREARTEELIQRISEKRESDSRTLESTRAGETGSQGSK